MDIRMKAKVPARTNPDEIPAYLSTESLDRLANLVIVKPVPKNQNGVPPMQVNAGSSPVSRFMGS